MKGSVAMVMLATRNTSPRKYLGKEKKVSTPPTSLTVQPLALWMNNCSYDL